MRTSLILVAVAVLAACANDAETTAPRSTVAAASNVQSDEQKPFAPGPGAAAKPPSTTTTQVVGDRTVVDGINQLITEAFAQCPAGSVVVGGGHEFESNAAFAAIARSGPSGPSAWGVRVLVPMGTAAAFRAIAMCQTVPAK